MMDPALRARLDRHIISARTKMFRAIAGGSFEIMRDWVRAYSGLSIPTYNIFQPLTAQGLTDDTLADTAAYFASMETLYTVELIHDKFPEGPDFLDKRYYQSLPPQMMMYLHGHHDESHIRLNIGVEIERVKNVPTLTAFCTLLHQVFDFSLDDMVTYFPVRHLGDGLKQNIQHYLAFVDEQPIGAGTMIFIDGVASVWNVCTVDDYRRRGVATTLLHDMLTDADERGCPLKVLYSTPHAFSLFHKYSFEIFAQSQWFLPPGLDYEDD